MCSFMYRCGYSECGNSYSSETSLQEHEVDAHPSLNFCLVCHKGLRNPVLLKYHMTAHQANLHCCNICGELCENKIDVYVHVTTSHKYEGKKVCDLCSKTFSSNSCLKMHCRNEHGEEMPHVLQKWELFCSIHSSLNLCREDVLKDSFYPFDCHLHPKEKESRDETNSARSNASKSNQSILLSETMDDKERPPDSGSPAMTDELQTFLQEHGDKESWYTTSTDHLSNSIRPDDILVRVRSLTKDKNLIQKDPTLKCHLCNTTFSNRNDYLLAHGGQDPWNEFSHKQDPQKALQDFVIKFCKINAGNTTRVPPKKYIKGLFGIKNSVIHQDRNASAENQTGRLHANGNLIVKNVLTSQIQNKNASDANQKDQFDPNGNFLPEISALNKTRIKTKVQKIKINRSRNVFLSEISALTNQNKLDDVIVSEANKFLSDSNYATKR